jgi:hypothetical protein
MTKPKTKKKAATPADALLTTEEMASWWKESPKWFAHVRGLGAGPPFIVIRPGVVRYSRAGALAWLAERVHRRTDEYINKDGSRRRGRPRKNYLAGAADILTEA